KGTKVISLVGKINRPGLVEVPIGKKMSDIIYDIGGGIPNNRKFKAVQTGGPSGGCIPAEKLDIEVDYENLKELGSIVGSGGMVVMDEDTCMVDVAKYFLTFTSDESCGQCPPCRVGTSRMLELLDKICLGKGKKTDLNLLEDLSLQVRDTSLCALGGTAPNPVLTTLKYFRDQYEEHIIKKRCEASVCAALFRAPCQNTCPAGTDVPGYIQLINEGKYGEAYELNRESNPFPSICGRVCERPCEYRCRRGEFDEPLAIRELKRFCADMVFAGKGGYQPPITRLEPTGKKVVIVGGGPSGLTAAYFLTRLGYSTTIFEASEKLGGMLIYGIPQYRLPHNRVEKEIADVLKLGIKVYNNCAIGKDIMLSHLLEKYDAVYLAVGNQKNARLGLDGEDLPGILSGIEFLKKINTDGGKDIDPGKSAIVIGGGNVAIDVARSLIRMGCVKVTICYRREEQDMPAYKEEIIEAKNEGIEFNFLLAPEEILVKDGKAVGILFRKNIMGEYTKWGRRKPMPMDQTVKIWADSIVIAIGQVLDPGFTKEANGQLISNRTLIHVKKETLATLCEKVFAGGDAVTGPKSVIEAIAQGKRAAKSIDEYITGKNERFIELEKMCPIRYSMNEPDNEIIMVRQIPNETSAEERIHSFNEVVLCLDEERAQKEAFRCFRCDLSSFEELEGRG
ncbi:MAG: FAD-dependent oxidoreductase, partial [Thermoplasmata archaeon]